MSARFAIEALTKAHQRKTFSCGNERIDRYFRETVTQDIKRRMHELLGYGLALEGLGACMAREQVG